MSNAVVNPFLSYLGQGIYYGVSIYIWIVIIRVLLTWINPNPHTPVMRFLAQAVDPLLNLGRRWFPLTLGGIDFSPVLTIITINLAGVVLGQWLISLGHGAPVLVLIPLLAVALVTLLNSLAWLLIIIMLARLVMSLVRPSPYNMLVQIVYGLSEPLLAPLRRFFPPGPKGMDWRPLIFLITIMLVQQVVLGSLAQAALLWMGGVASGF